MDIADKNSDNFEKIGFLGLGKMAGAVLGGIIANRIAEPANIYGYDISPQRREYWSERGEHGIRVTSDPVDTVKQCDVLVIAVKPQNFTELFDSIRGALRINVPIISIAAGVSIEKIKQLAGKDLPVIRVMPNNPMLTGYGMSVVAYELPVTAEQAAFAERMFSACGKTVIMREELINPSIAIHSSSPAYLYLFAKAVSEYAEDVGIGKEEALKMFAQTLIGSGYMIERAVSSGEDMDELIAAVRSPGGTTAASLDVFAEEGFCDIIKKAMNACTERADQLGGLK